MKRVIAQISDKVEVVHSKTDAVGSTLEPLHIFGAIFMLAAIAGIAPLLNSKRELCTRLLVGAFLQSGVMGLIVGLVWWSNYGETNLFFLIGISGLAGLGGNYTLGLAILYAKKKLNLEQAIRDLCERDKGDE